MKGAIRLFSISNISINVHITFLILPVLFYIFAGFRGVFLIIAVFVFVTIHELCHSLVARRYGIRTPEITLLPIGGVASMARMPEKPLHEFRISLAGPLFNIIFSIIMAVPAYRLLGRDVFFNPSLDSWPQTFAYLFWINPILAVFNLIPAFPMDGGRVLRALLARRMGFKKATEIAVNFGHVFALLFGFMGILYGHILLIIIAVFVYMAASNEGVQVELKEVLKKYHVSDILPDKFVSLKQDVTLSNVLEIIFHKHQEDFPIVENGQLVGFLTRNDIISSLHQHGAGIRVCDVMRKTFPSVKPKDSLHKVQAIMNSFGLKAVPVMQDGGLKGIVTLEDIGRIYAVVSEK